MLRHSSDMVEVLFFFTSPLKLLQGAVNPSSGIQNFDVVLNCMDLCEFRTAHAVELLILENLLFEVICAPKPHKYPSQPADYMCVFMP